MPSTSKHATGADTAKPMVEPKPPFPKQHQQPPGSEAELDPAPRWRGERYKPAGKLEGQVAIVTGGDSGIGRSVAYHFAREGADVAITCLPVEKEDAKTTREAIEALGRTCKVYAGDLTDAEFCDNVVDRALDDFGRVNILVSNAAWQNRKPIDELSDDELDRTLKTNVYACLRLARRVVPKMEPGSSIIVTGSIVGLQGAEDLGDYGATKGALHAITKCLAKELTDKKIRVNCVAPGPVWTPLNPADTGLTAGEVAKFGQETGKSAMGRPAQPEELAPAYVFLASNADSSYITGAVLPVTGEPV
jgi:NAD(P)-dependent dehydrogenase (short-subunit alcohol dehydrogenase family)